MRQIYAGQHLLEKSIFLILGVLFIIFSNLVRELEIGI